MKLYIGNARGLIRFDGLKLDYRIDQWCHENLEYSPYLSIHNLSLEFQNEIDAMLFKMAFGEYW